MSLKFISLVSDKNTEFMTIAITTYFNSAVEWTERLFQILNKKDALICNIRCVIFDTSICQLISCFNPQKYGYLHKLNAVFLTSIIRCWVLPTIGWVARSWWSSGLSVLPSTLSLGKVLVLGWAVLLNSCKLS